MEPANLGVCRLNWVLCMFIAYDCQVNDVVINTNIHVSPCVCFSVHPVDCTAVHIE